MRKKGKKIVWTNGCFDLLHIGHIHLLREAKKFGDVLIVGINSDESVKKLKGPGRPIQNERQRAEILSSLEFVDYILIYPDETAHKYVSVLKPDFYVKGGDFSIEFLTSFIEGKTVKEYGGEVKTVPIIDGLSTAKILNRIKEGDK